MLTSLVFFSALAAAPDPAGFQPAIINGAPEDGFPAVVALGLDLDDYSFSACTGTLITPRVVLSAAHCGADLPLDLVVKLGDAFFGPDIWHPDAVLGFQDMAIHPDYVPLESGPTGTSEYGRYDLAVLVLSEDAPVAPARLFTGTLDEELVGIELMSVGFGLTDPDNSNSSGEKYSVELVLSELWEYYLLQDADDTEDGGTICSGDSGGPQFAKLDDSGEWLQVGIHSWGDVGCTDTSASTRVDVPMDWILDQVEAVHGTDDLCEINGQYSDGTCQSWCAADPDCLVAEAPSEEEGGAQGCSALAGGVGLLLVLPGLWARRRRRG